MWTIELRRRFNLNFALFDLVRTAAIKEHDPEQNVFTTEQCIIAGMDLLLDHPDLYDQAMEAALIYWSSMKRITCIDEAQGGNDKYDLIADFAEETPGVMLLTATPEQLCASQSHFARLRLLDPDRFDDLDEFIDSQEAFAETAAVASVLIEDKPLSDGQIAALSHLLSISIDELANINDDEKTAYLCA